MLRSSLVALWFLLFFSHVHGLDDRSKIVICSVNGTFGVDDECPADSNSLQIIDGNIISHPASISSATSRTVESSPIASSTSSSSGSSASAPGISTSSTTQSENFAQSHSAVPMSSSSSMPTSSIPATTSSSPPSSSATSNPLWATLPTIGDAPEPKGGSFSITKLYQGKSFIDEWDFFNDSDPTNGLVTYVNQQDAVSLGLITVEGNTTTIKVDDTTKLQSGQKRNSVRIASQIRMTGGLLIASIKAMPAGCSTWPAFWLVGKDWPTQGEVDIIEGVNLQTRNQMTLHTLAGCMRNDNAQPALGQKQAFTGTPLQISCDASINSNSGCGVMSASTKTFGENFNAIGGGVFATIWDTLGFRIWAFPNGTVPNDILAMNPTPSEWPIPDAFFDSTTCPVDKYFANLQIVFDTTLCGDFAGALFPSSGCQGTCAQTVADPENFKNAQWVIDYVALYN